MDDDRIAGRFPRPTGSAQNGGRLSGAITSCDHCHQTGNPAVAGEKSEIKKGPCLMGRGLVRAIIILGDMMCSKNSLTSPGGDNPFHLRHRCAIHGVASVFIRHQGSADYRKRPDDESAFPTATSGQPSYGPLSPPPAETAAGSRRGLPHRP